MKASQVSQQNMPSETDVGAQSEIRQSTISEYQGQVGQDFNSKDFANLPQNHPQ